MMACEIRIYIAMSLDGGGEYGRGSTRTWWGSPCVGSVAIYRETLHQVVCAGIVISGALNDYSMAAGVRNEILQLFKLYDQLYAKMV
jgi:hypothetical protein